MAFQNTLLIIKPDYLHKRKPVLLKLLEEEFQIQGHRKLIFSPELAAEFYAELAEEEGFMLEVILLSKGTSEAFILTKENAVQDLLNVMICYFTSSAEMERNVHVTKHCSRAAREINFIFPNYIHEPIQFFEKQTFCNRPMLKPLIAEIYDILQNVDCSEDNWKIRVADYLYRSNKKMPMISNQCMPRPDALIQERAQQTIVSYASPAKDAVPRKPYKSSESKSSVLSSTSPHSSMILTSSSCVSCGGFERSEICIPSIDLNKRLEPQDREKICEDEEIVWKEVIVYEEVIPEEEEEEAKFAGEKFAQLEEEGGEGGGHMLTGFDQVPSDVELGSAMDEYDDAMPPAAAEAAEEAIAPPPPKPPVEASPPPPPPAPPAEAPPPPPPEPAAEPEPAPPVEEPPPKEEAADAPPAEAE